MSALSFDVQPPSSVDIRALRLRLNGDLVLPDEPGWDDARHAWNLAVDQRPFAVAFVETAKDVVSVVQFARVHGLRVAPQGTGHGASALESLEDTILVKTERMRRVEIDTESQTFRAEAGALWQDVVEPATEQGFLVLHGSSPDVGVVGYTLGGGMGWLARSRGLSANSVVAVELVTADGRLVRADRDNEPDLFWAVRGGGGSFGIVTAIEIRMYETPELYAGALFWPVERAAEVLQAWREWAETVPDEVTSVGRVLHLPPVPDVPEPLRGKSFVVVEAVFTGPEAEGAALTAPLRALGPAVDTFAAVAPQALPHLHMDPPKPVPGVGDGMFLDELPPAAIEAMVATATPPLLSLEIRPLGGKLAEPSISHGAVGAIEAGFALCAVGIAPTPEIGEAIERAVDRVKDAFAPWESSRTYFNFAERGVDAERLYPAETYHRLRRVKTQYDAGELFVANHPIPPAR
jgi:FAD binding domain/Berberine and berberine like